MELGASVDDLDRAASALSSAGERLVLAANALERSAWRVSARFTAQRAAASSTAGRLRREGLTAQALAARLHHERSEQVAVSSDASPGGTAFPHTLMAGSGLIAGAVTQVRGIPRTFSKLGWSGVEVVGAYGDTIDDSAKLLDFGRSLVRSQYWMPRAPRTWKGLARKIDAGALRETFTAKRIATSATRVRHLRTLLVDVTLGSASILGRDHGGTVGGLLEKGADIWSDARQFKSVAHLKSLRSFSAIKQVHWLRGGATVASKFGGGLAILGGTLDAIDAIGRFRNATSKDAKVRASRDGAIGAASVVGGVLMFTPAAPIGAAIVAGATVAKAGAWVWDNREKLKRYAGRASAALTAALPTVTATTVRTATAVAAAPAKLASQLTAGAAKTFRSVFGRKR